MKKLDILKHYCPHVSPILSIQAMEREANSSPVLVKMTSKLSKALDNTEYPPLVIKRIRDGAAKLSYFMIGGKAIIEILY